MNSITDKAERLAALESAAADIAEQIHALRAELLAASMPGDVLKDIHYLDEFDLIHASPPCQSHSRTKHLRDAQGGNLKAHGEDMVDEVRQALLASGVPFVLENVPGAPLRQDLLLCVAADVLVGLANQLAVDATRGRP